MPTLAEIALEYLIIEDVTSCLVSYVHGAAYVGSPPP